MSKTGLRGLIAFVRIGVTIYVFVGLFSAVDVRSTIAFAAALLWIAIDSVGESIERSKGE